jgi:hypothetical protein
VADRTTRHSRRRRPQIKYQRKRNGFARVVSAFNKGLEVHFPLVPYRDSLGRSRTSGRCRRARAAAVLQALLVCQVSVRSGIVYMGYEGLGKLCHRSRSTAYRAVADLVAASMLQRSSGGGKTHDDNGQVVDAANGYQVPEELLGPDVRQPRRPRKDVDAAPAVPSAGQRMAEERLEAHRGRMRAPP